jgi:hypothetical protein
MEPANESAPWNTNDDEFDDDDGDIRVYVRPNIFFNPIIFAICTKYFQQIGYNL